MKKITIALAAVTFVAFSMTSCKKSYHCECTSGGITTKNPSVKLGKIDATAQKVVCEAGTTPGTTGTTCTWVTE